MCLAISPCVSLSLSLCLDMLNLTIDKEGTTEAQNHNPKQHDHCFDKHRKIPKSVGK